MKIDPRQLQKAMRQLGVEQQEIEAEQVIIRLPDKDLVIDNPSVAIVNMMGQESFQISGDVQEKQRDTSPAISDADIEAVVAQTGASKEKAMKALENADGDIAKAILALSEKA
jgi:nascent polypeptide-associated complex subunit alpha